MHRAPMSSSTCNSIFLKSIFKTRIRYLIVSKHRHCARFLQKSSFSPKLSLRMELFWTWGSGPSRFFFFFLIFSLYIYIILFLAICFNKIELCPSNNIFKSYKKISLTTKIKLKHHPKTNTCKK